jgi:hypothetical protein
VCVVIYDGIYLFKSGRRIGAGGMHLHKLSYDYIKVSAHSNGHIKTTNS